MTTSRSWAMTALLLAAMTAGPAYTQQSAAFVLANNTEFTVLSVYYWPSSSGFRRTDRLGDDVIPSGESYTFAPRDGGCMYNVSVTLRESEYEEQWNNINLCDLHTLTLNFNYVNEDLWVSRN